MPPFHDVAPSIATSTSSGLSRSCTVVGIGINVNQREFSADIPNPVSLTLLTGKNYDLDSLLRSFERSLAERYRQLKEGEWDLLQADYHSSLYRLNEWHTYALPNGARFEGAIRGVQTTGELIVEDRKGAKNGYLFKEIEFVIAKN